MSVTRGIRVFIAASVALVVATWSARAPHAQATPLTLKQQLLAGGALPLTLAAEHTRLAALPRPRLAPGRIVVKTVDGAASATLQSLAARLGAQSISYPANADFVHRHVASSTPTSWPRPPTSRLNRASSMRNRIRWRCSPTSRTTRSTSTSGIFHRIGMERAWDINRGANRRDDCRRSSTRGWPTSIRAPSTRRPTWRAPRSSLRTTSSGTTRRRRIWMGTARTSRARSASAPGMAWAPPAWRSTSRSCP